MTAAIYGFGKQDAENLLQLSRERRSGRNGVSAPEPIRGSIAFWMMQATSSISAADRATVPMAPGSGTAKILWKDGSQLAEYDRKGEDVTVYNVATDAIDADKLIGVVRDVFGTHWVIFELCE